MSKYTSGPWHAIIIGTDGPSARIYAGTLTDGPDIAHLNSQYTNVEANAHLIAAAPDLLDACKAALLMLEACGVVDVAVAPLKAAIDKAEGGSE